jgi:cell division protein FtsL
MLTNEVSLNIYLLAFILGLSIFVGFAFRARMILKARAKIEELEREILNNYEVILELERETLNMESKIQDIKSPVITMKSQNNEEPLTSKKVPNIALRKQLLAKKNLGRQSATGL